MPTHPTSFRPSEPNFFAKLFFAEKSLIFVDLQYQLPAGNRREMERAEGLPLAPIS
jgi:hypothetical protein